MTQTAKKPATSMLREEVKGLSVSYSIFTYSRFSTYVIIRHHEA